MAEIICNKTDGDTGEEILIKLKWKTISNKEKTAVYNVFSERLVKRGYGQRKSKSVTRIWNILCGKYIKAKEILKTKSGVKALKNSPWVLHIAEEIKKCNIETDLDDMVLDSKDNSKCHA